MEFHHVGIACRHIEDEINRISAIHKIKEKTAIIYDQEQNASVCLLVLEEGVDIELISGKQVDTILKKNITYYHLCYEVNDINSEIEKLLNNGAYLISPPKPAILFNNRSVAFLQVSYGLIELLSSI
jgi:methylmalonyl-CoA/ethylmalonyl-CoA epimerase